MNLKNRGVHFLIIISAIIIIDLVSFEIATPANNTEIIIDENLKPGMTLKDAIELLGPPEKIKVNDAGMVVIPYNILGLLLEIKDNETVVEKIHVQSSFTGQFASGIKIGSDYQKILTAYNQPDIMTKETMEYTDLSRSFKIEEGKLTGADLYLPTSTLYTKVKNIDPVEYKDVPEKISERVSEESREKVEKELREELRKEVREEMREEVIEEVRKGLSEDVNVFDLYGLKVRQTSRGVVIKEIRAGSVAEKGGLKIGEPVRKAFYEGSERLNIYYVKGLEAVLRRAVNKYKKTVNILQDKNHYYKVEVPKRK